MSEYDDYVTAMKSMPLHSEHIQQDNTLEDTEIETHYLMCKWVISGGPQEQRYLRVTADDNSTDIETRVLYATLISMGWTPPVETFPMEREKGCEQPHI